MRRFAGTLLVLASLLFPRLARACPVCGQGREGTESALLVMSGVLSALPLLMAGGIAVWIVLRARAASRERSAHAVAAAAERPTESTPSSIS